MSGLGNEWPRQKEREAVSSYGWFRSAATGRRLPLDPADQRIMALLRANGRCSYRRLADETGLSESAVRHRVTRLMNHGVFRITIVTDPLAMHRLAARLRLRVSGRAASLVAAEIAALPETDFVALATGDHGLIVDLSCDDHAHLTRSVDEIRGTRGVLDVDVSLVLGVAKNEVVW